MKCEKCGEVLSQFEKLDDPEAVPRDGDLSLCFYCGKVTMFDKGNLRNLTQEEEETLSDDIRREIEKIEIARERTSIILKDK